MDAEADCVTNAAESLGKKQANGSGDAVGVLAVVVTFFPKRSVVANVAALLDEVAQILIVDNATTGKCAEYVEEAAGLSDRIELIRMEQNVGMASALNCAVERIMKTDCDWLLEMDQDSRVTPGMVETMLSTYSLYPEPQCVAILCPVAREVSRGTLMERKHRGSARRDARWREVLWSITSGSLTKVSVLRKIGAYDDTLFIDCVDADYCLRCDKAGYRILEISDATLEHRLGEQTGHQVFGKKVWVSNHAPIRRYYIARNRVVMVRRYFFRYPILMTRFVLGILLRHVIMVALFEREKLIKLRYVGRGILHGLLGVGGRLA